MFYGYDSNKWLINNQKCNKAQPVSRSLNERKEKKDVTSYKV